MLNPEKTSAITHQQRHDWVDQLKGFTIFLVVYGHNFPFCEKYIYSFHMPLFMMIAGFFHPNRSAGEQVRKRFISLVAPYFLWSTFLYGIWYFVTRKFGDSASLDLSPLKNLIGVFWAQGDRDYMDWGIPMWFLPALFVTFLAFWAVLKIESRTIRFLVLGLAVATGLFYPHFSRLNLVWSANIAMTALFFYAAGFYGFGRISSLSKRQAIFTMAATCVIHALLFGLNAKVDMYRAIYGNEALFLINGITGSLFVLCFFKSFPVFKFLGFIGKFSLTILALQLLAMTFIKAVILLATGDAVFEFSEAERFLFAIVQIALMVPLFFLINKYAPILNGGFKKI